MAKADKGELSDVDSVMDAGVNPDGPKLDAAPEQAPVTATQLRKSAAQRSRSNGRSSRSMPHMKDTGNNGAVAVLLDEPVDPVQPPEPAPDDNVEVVDPVDEAPVEEQAPAPDAWLTKDLEKLGSAYQLSRDDLIAMGSVENMDRTLTLMDRQMSAMLGRNAGAAPTMTPPPPATPAQSPPAATPPQVQPANAAAQIAKYISKLKPDDVEPELYNEITGLSEHYEKQISSVVGQNENLARNLMSLSARLIEDKLDSVRDKMPDEVKRVIGDEPLSEMTPDSPQFKAVQEVYLTMDNLATAYSRAGVRSPGLKSLMLRAFRQIHGNPSAKEAAKNERERIKEKLEQREALAVAPPTSRVVPQNPNVMLAKRMAERMRSMGLDGVAADNDESVFL